LTITIHHRNDGEVWWIIRKDYKSRLSSRAATSIACESREDRCSFSKVLSHIGDLKSGRRILVSSTLQQLQRSGRDGGSQRGRTCSGPSLVRAMQFTLPFLRDLIE